jgi:hypothetical protein
MSRESDPVDSISALRSRLRARAAGLWRVEGGSLRAVAFSAVDDMPRDVADGFARATAVVPITPGALGIVAAAVTGRPAISVASDLPAGVGSGYWLREFGAMRSVAVPLVREGRVVGVVAVALPTLAPPDLDVVSALLTESSDWIAPV